MPEVFQGGMTKYLALVWETAQHRRLAPVELFSGATLSLHDTPCGVLSQ